MKNACIGCDKGYPLVNGIHIAPSGGQNLICTRPAGCPTKRKLKKEIQDKINNKHDTIAIIDTSGLKANSLNITDISQRWAIELHSGTNHRYGNNEPYVVHLRMVVNMVILYYKASLIPNKHLDLLISAAWLHDVIEDCRVSYNDVKQKVGSDVADLVYALTNLRGKNRAERAGDEYYKGIRDIKYASFLKACDRLANYSYSIQTKSRMTKMYEKEMKHFFDVLHPEETSVIANVIYSMMDETKISL